MGVGLLGGSVALAAKAADESVRVIGVGRRQSSLDRALAVGAIDQATTDTATGVRGSDLVILATPLSSYGQHLLDMLPVLKRGALVTDVGSTKAGVVAQAEKILGPGGPFVGSHPMAGSERKGVEFARADLFVNRVCLLTPTARTPQAVLAAVEAFWEKLGALTLQMSPFQHDKAVARVSHLPHLLASLTVQIQKAGSLDLAGAGFLDTTRVASGDPAMWREIVLSNRQAILSAIDDAQRQLQRLRGMIDASDERRLEQFLTQAKTHRDQLVAQRRAREE